MSAPDIGVITSIGSAHIGELGSRVAIARAKSELLESLPAGGVAVIPSNSNFADMMLDATSARTVTVGEGGDYHVIEWRQSGGFVEFAIRCPSGDVAGTVPGIGEMQAKNAAMAIAAAAAAGVPPESAAGALRRSVFPEKRMQVIDRDGITIWFDAYNSSPESCQLALAAFADLKVTGRKIAILGDMLELGEHAEPAHREVGIFAAQIGLDELVLVGSLAPWIGSAARDVGFTGEVSFFSDSASAHVAIACAKPGDAILMKASRGVELEAALGDSK
jgi:UDP-N-acetylmuramoyl-tripeptide--D-alanyl-D-alanine ligase